MTESIPSSARARRLRNALLASAFTVGIAGAAGTGALLSDSHVALAEQVQVTAPTVADFTSVVEAVKPAVVSVQVKTEVADVSNRRMMEGFDDLPPDHPLNEFFRRFGGPDNFGFEFRDRDGRGPHHPRRGLSQGSGFFVSEDGYLVTNAHVIEGGREYTVTLDDGTEADAELIGTDKRTDLALLKVDGDNFKYVTLAKEAPKVGQWVLAIGNPFGLGGSVTAGIISADGRDIGSGPYDNFLQIDASVNRGNSGGPAFNIKGEVVGVNTAIFSPSGGNVGIAFAIPAAMVEEVVQDLRDDGTVTRGWLGVQIQPVTEDIAESLGIESTDGAIVADAMADGPAAGAGIQTGDIITEVNG
jgi:serine protease Do